LLSQHNSYQEKIAESVKYLKSCLDLTPEFVIQLGSGLGEVTESIKNPQKIAFADIPHFPQLNGSSHEGYLFSGELGGKNTAILQGRAHYYEGYSAHEITTPLRVLSLLGAKTYIVTNAAGGLNPNYRPGTLMLIEDHLNAMGINPLRGPNVPDWGPRFPDLSKVYSRRLRKMVVEIAKNKKLTMERGVYAAVAGPSLETPAETRALRQAGADAVGMSTVPEVIVASHAGLEILGLSVLANINDPDNFQEIREDDILAKMAQITPALGQLLLDLLKEI